MFNDKSTSAVGCQTKVLWKHADYMKIIDTVVFTNYI